MRTLACVGEKGEEGPLGDSLSRMPKQSPTVVEK